MYSKDRRSRICAVPVIEVRALVTAAVVCSNIGADTSWVMDLIMFVFFRFFFGQMNSSSIHYCIARQHYLLYSPCPCGNFPDSCLLKESAFELEAYNAVMCSILSCYCTAREEKKFKCVRSRGHMCRIESKM
jgi:hypothetical protein